MNTLIVTSRVTFVRDNGFECLKTLTEKAGADIAGLVVIDNLEPSLVLKALFISLAGAWRIGGILLLNSLTCLFKKRERLFRRSIRTKSLNSPETLENIRSMNPDLIINIRTREIYHKELLDIPRLACINVHHGILPENRGTMCDLWAFYEKRDVGFSVHYMNEKIDAGGLIAVETIMPETLNDYSKIPQESSRKEARVLLDVIERFRNGTVNAMPNVCETVRFKKNPTWREIRNMKRSGLRL